MKNQTIFELYTDDNKSKYSSNPMNILKSEKKKWNATASALPQLLLPSLKIRNRKKISYEYFNLCELKYL